MRSRVGVPGALAVFSLSAALLAACSSSDASNDSVGPACNGVSPAGLASEQTPAGQCPTHPTTLTGSGTEGTACSDSTDCAPTCCTCAGTGGAAAVAMCSNGSCLVASLACCLYSEGCGQ